LDLNVDDSFNFSMNGPKCPYASKNDVNDFIKIQKTSSSTIQVNVTPAERVMQVTSVKRNKVQTLLAAFFVFLANKGYFP
jgi:hypothetical protein